MSRADDRILEHLAEEGPDTPKKWLTVTASGSLDSTSTPAVKLVTYGLLVHLGNGVYDITQKGNSISPANSTLVTSRGE